MDEIEKYIRENIEKRNHEPIADFEGYSPTEMQFILYDPFSSNSPIQFNKMLEEEYLKIPLLNQIKLLYKIIKEEGELNLTKRGYLPIKTVAQLYNQGYLKDDLIELGISKLYKEEQVPVLTLTRILIEISQLVKKRNNKLSVTKKGEKIIKNDQLLFQHIFEIFATQLNWPYFDGYENEEVGQFGFGFSLILLAKHGNTSRKTDFYAKKYLKAFDFKEDKNSDFSDNLEKAYSIRTFDRFLDYFGFISLEGEDLLDFKKVTKTNLFDKAIKIRPHNIG